MDSRNIGVIINIALVVGILLFIGALTTISEVGAGVNIFVAAIGLALTVGAILIKKKQYAEHTEASKNNSTRQMFEDILADGKIDEEEIAKLKGETCDIKVDDNSNGGDN